MEYESRTLMGFPYATGPVRKLMVELVSTMEARMSDQLLPCTLPPDVQLYNNPDGSALSSLLIRSGVPGSPIDFMLVNWLHCELPNGKALSIAALSCYLNDATYAPYFQLEIYQTSPTTMLFGVDFCPRKDPTLHPDYLQTFYLETRLEEERLPIYALPEVRPYFSPSLYLRTLFSPTSILVSIDTGESESRMDEIVEENIGPLAKRWLEVWLGFVAGGERVVEEEEREVLRERDRVIKGKMIEIHLAPNLPRMFGKETADRVLEVLRAIFNK